MSLSLFAQMVELVDTPDLGSGAVRYVGSSPILGIFSDPRPVHPILTRRSEGASETPSVPNYKKNSSQTDLTTLGASYKSH